MATSFSRGRKCVHAAHPHGDLGYYFGAAWGVELHLHHLIDRAVGHVLQPTLPGERVPQPLKDRVSEPSDGPLLRDLLKEEEHVAVAPSLDDMASGQSSGTHEMGLSIDDLATQTLRHGR